MDKNPLVSQTGRTRSVYGSPGQAQRGPDLSGVSSGGQIQQQQQPPPSGFLSSLAGLIQTTFGSTSSSTSSSSVGYQRVDSGNDNVGVTAGTSARSPMGEKEQEAFNAGIAALGISQEDLAKFSAKHVHDYHILEKLLRGDQPLLTVVNGQLQAQPQIVGMNSSLLLTLGKALSSSGLHAQAATLLLTLAQAYPEASEAAAAGKLADAALQVVSEHPNLTQAQANALDAKVAMLAKKPGVLTQQAHQHWKGQLAYAAGQEKAGRKEHQRDQPMTEYGLKEVTQVYVAAFNEAAKAGEPCGRGGGLWAAEVAVRCGVLPVRDFRAGQALGPDGQHERCQALRRRRESAQGCRCVLVGQGGGDAQPGRAQGLQASDPQQAVPGFPQGQRRRGA